MVLTTKFSEFATAAQNNPDQEVVGLENGANVQSLRTLSWTTATRPATPYNGLLGLNTDLEVYEYFNTPANMWLQIADSATNVFAILASHANGEGASLIGLQNQSLVTGKTVQDMANAQFIVQVNNGSLENAQALGSLTTGIVKSTTGTGVLSISAPLTSIDNLTTTANEFLYTTAPNTFTTSAITALGRTLLADTTKANMLATLGLGPATDGQLIIGSTGVDPVLANIIGTSGVTVSNGPGTITLSASAAGLGWNLVTGTSATMTPNSGYIIGNAAHTTLTLPATCALGDIIAVVGNGLGGWTIAQNDSPPASQFIQIGNIVSTAGSSGYVQSTNRYDCIFLVCINPNTEFTTIAGPQGTVITDQGSANALNANPVTPLSSLFGGTGHSNADTITLGGALHTAGALTTVGAFGVTFNFTALTSVTFPTSGTLVSTTGGNSLTIAGGNALTLTTTGTTNVTLPTTGTLINNAQPTINQPNIVGLTTSASVAAGSVGEIISSVIPQSSAVGLTDNTAANVTFIDLTAGNWDVWGNVTITFAGVLTGNPHAVGWISTTSVTVPDRSLYSSLYAGTTPFSGVLSTSVPGFTEQVNTTTRVYLSALANFPSGSAGACGGIYARRRA